MALILRFFRISVVLLLVVVGSFSARAQNPDWSKPYKPFCIAGNLYYVGTYDLACYLLTTPKGHILINAGLESTVPMLRAHVEQLGIRFSDIKILLSSQAHFDHVGGMWEIQKLTGAKVMIDEGDKAVIEDGGNSDFLFGGKGKGSLFPAVMVDRVLHDGDIIELGGMKIMHLHHPGHTKGSSSYLFSVQDFYRHYRVLIANMPTILDETDLNGMATYPEVGCDYLYTLKSLQELRFDLWLCAHASQFGLHKVRSENDGCNPSVFMDRAAYDAELTGLLQAYNKRLKK
jgi:metallo-beta-lactamase class B